MPRRRNWQPVLSLADTHKLFAEMQAAVIKSSLMTCFTLGIGTNGDGGFCVLALSNDHFKILKGTATYTKAWYVDSTKTVGKKVPSRKIPLLMDGNFWKCRIK